LQRGLKVSSTLGLLEEASYRGMLQFEATIERLINETSFYVAEDVLADYRRRAAERRTAADANHAQSTGTAPEPDDEPTQDRT
jgi:hypothetical protein